MKQSVVLQCPIQVVQAYDICAVPASVLLCLEVFSKAVSKSSTHMQWRQVIVLRNQCLQKHLLANVMGVVMHMQQFPQIGSFECALHHDQNFPLEIKFQTLNGKRMDSKPLLTVAPLLTNFSTPILLSLSPPK